MTMTKDEALAWLGETEQFYHTTGMICRSETLEDMGRMIAALRAVLTYEIPDSVDFEHSHYNHGIEAVQAQLAARGAGDAFVPRRRFAHGTLVLRARWSPPVRGTGRSRRTIVPGIAHVRPASSRSGHCGCPAPPDRTPDPGPASSAARSRAVRSARASAGSGWR